MWPHPLCQFDWSHAATTSEQSDWRTEPWHFKQPLHCTQWSLNKRAMSYAKEDLNTVTDDKQHKHTKTPVWTLPLAAPLVKLFTCQVSRMQLHSVACNANAPTIRNYSAITSNTRIAATMTEIHACLFINCIFSRHQTLSYSKSMTCKSNPLQPNLCLRCQSPWELYKRSGHMSTILSVYLWARFHIIFVPTHCPQRIAACYLTLFSFRSFW